MDAKGVFELNKNARGTAGVIITPAKKFMTPIKNVTRDKNYHMIITKIKEKLLHHVTVLNKSTASTFETQV